MSNRNPNDSVQGGQLIVYLANTNGNLPNINTLSWVQVVNTNVSAPGSPNPKVDTTPDPNHPDNPFYEDKAADQLTIQAFQQGTGIGTQLVFADQPNRDAWTLLTNVLNTGQAAWNWQADLYLVQKNTTNRTITILAAFSWGLQFTPTSMQMLPFSEVGTGPINNNDVALIQNTKPSDGKGNYKVLP